MVIPSSSDTDSQALTWLHSARYQNTKLERWALKVQELSFEVVHRRGEDNIVADCLSRMHEPSDESAGVCVGAVWTGQSKKQSDLYKVPCEICGDPDGWDNIVICDGCGRCMHLRCLVPPQTTAPSGPLFCPACDIHFENGVEELSAGHWSMRCATLTWIPISSSSSPTTTTRPSYPLHLHSGGRSSTRAPDYAVIPDTLIGSLSTRKFSIMVLGGCAALPCSIGGTLLGCFMRLLATLAFSRL